FESLWNFFSSNFGWQVVINTLQSDKSKADAGDVVLPEVLEPQPGTFAAFITARIDGFIFKPRGDIQGRVCDITLQTHALTPVFGSHEATRCCQGSSGVCTQAASKCAVPPGVR